MPDIFFFFGEGSESFSEPSLSSMSAPSESSLVSEYIVCRTRDYTGVDLMVQNTGKLTPIQRSFCATNTTRRNVATYANCPGFDTDRAQVVCDFRMEDDNPNQQNAQVILNWQRVGVLQREQYFAIEVNRITDSLRIRRFRNLTWSPNLIPDIPGLGLSTGRWYRLLVTVARITEPGGGVSITATLRDVAAEIEIATVGPLNTTNYGTPDGMMGIGTDQAKSCFSFFGVIPTEE